jgi:hypothetical protein
VRRKATSYKEPAGKSSSSSRQASQPNVYGLSTSRLKSSSFGDHAAATAAPLAVDAIGKVRTVALLTPSSVPAYAAEPCPPTSAIEVLDRRTGPTKTAEPTVVFHFVSHPLDCFRRAHDNTSSASGSREPTRFRSKAVQMARATGGGTALPALRHSRA